MTKQHAADALADILWFIKGTLVADSSLGDRISLFGFVHVEALRVARNELLKGEGNEADKTVSK